MEEYKQISSKEVYNGKIMKVYSEEIVLPNGKTAVREVVRKASAAAVLPIDEDGKAILVRQYRHPINAMTFEIPAGIIDKFEDAQACAKRETAEEIGYLPQSLTYICSYYGSIGFCNELCHVYIGENLIKTDQDLDEEEFITTHKYTIKECQKMIESQEICDAKTILAILAYINMKE